MDLEDLEEDKMLQEDLKVGNVYTIILKGRLKEVLYIGRSGGRSKYQNVVIFPIADRVDRWAFNNYELDRDRLTLNDGFKSRLPEVEIDYARRRLIKAGMKVK